MRDHPRCHPLLVAAFVATGAGPGVQDDPDGGCPPCRLDLREAVVLDAGPAAAGPPVAWARASDGRLFVVSADSPFEIVVFSPAGRYLTTLGELGDEAGAYREIGALLVRADSLDVFDLRTRRLTVLDFEGRPVRRAALDVAVAEAVAAEGGGWWVAGRTAASDTVGRPLHRLSGDGTLESSHGDPAPMDWRGHDRLKRQIAEADDGTLWAAPAHTYRLRRRDGDGTMIADVDLTGADFPARERPLPVQPDQPAAPEIVDLHVMSDGGVLVLQHIAAPSWAAGLSPGPHPSPDGLVHDVIDPAMALDSRVELVDGEGTPVADVATDRLLYGFVDEDVVLGHAEVEGRPGWALWDLTVVPTGELRMADERGGPSVPRLALWFAAMGLASWLLAGRAWRSSR